MNDWSRRCILAGESSMEGLFASRIWKENGSWACPDNYPLYTFVVTAGQVLVSDIPSGSRCWVPLKVVRTDGPNQLFSVITRLGSHFRPQQAGGGHLGRSDRCRIVLLLTSGCFVEMQSWSPPKSAPNQVLNRIELCKQLGFSCWTTRQCSLAEP